MTDEVEDALLEMAAIIHAQLEAERVLRKLLDETEDEAEAEVDYFAIARECSA